MPTGQASWVSHDAPSFVHTNSYVPQNPRRRGAVITDLAPTIRLRGGNPRPPRRVAGRAPLHVLTPVPPPRHLNHNLGHTHRMVVRTVPPDSPRHSHQSRRFTTLIDAAAVAGEHAHEVKKMATSRCPTVGASTFRITAFAPPVLDDGHAQADDEADKKEKEAEKNAGNSPAACTFKTRAAFEKLHDILLQNQSVGSASVSFQQRLQASRRTRKPKPLSMTWHRDTISPPPANKILAAAATPDDMRCATARTTSIVRDRVQVVAPPHAKHDFQTLLRPPCPQEDRVAKAHWQKDYTHLPNPCEGCWDHMEHRHRELGPAGQARLTLCWQCKTVRLDTTSVTCRHCGAFEPALGLPSVFDRQFSPRLHKARGVSMTDTHRDVSLAAAPYENTVVGLTKQDFARAWRDGTEVVLRIHQAKAAAARAATRRDRAAFRTFGYRGVPPKDIGSQHSPRYRTGKLGLAEAQKARRRMLGLGNPMIAELKGRAAVAPAALKEMGVQGPLDRFHHIRGRD